MHTNRQTDTTHVTVYVLTDLSLALYTLDRCFASWGESEQAEGLDVMQHLFVCTCPATCSAVDAERDKGLLSLCESLLYLGYVKWYNGM